MSRRAGAPWSSEVSRRLASLRAALAFLQLRVQAPELRLLHRWLDTWAGIGLVVTGMTRHGFQLGLDLSGPKMTQRTAYTQAVVSISGRNIAEYTQPMMRRTVKGLVFPPSSGGQK
jgi:hypothetical protein